MLHERCAQEREDSHFEIAADEELASHGYGFVGVHLLSFEVEYRLSVIRLLLLESMAGLRCVLQK